MPAKSTLRPEDNRGAMPRNDLTRRSFLGSVATSLVGSFVGITPGAAEEQKKPVRNNHRGSPWRVHQDLTMEQPCNAIRLERFLPSCLNSKLFVRADGELAIRPLHALERCGWIHEHQESRHKPSKETQAVIADSTGLTSIGSGYLLKSNVDSPSHPHVATADHVLAYALQTLYDRRVANRALDLALFSDSFVHQHPSDNQTPQILELAPASITNAALSEQRVQIQGMGHDRFDLLGTPFRCSITSPVHSLFKVYEVFGLRLPDNFLEYPEELNGLSGSPVLLPGTNQVVGTVCQFNSTACSDSRKGRASKDGAANNHSSAPRTDCILFVGPDELRALMNKA